MGIVNWSRSSKLFRYDGPIPARKAARGWPIFEGSLGDIARQLRVVPENELFRYAIATDDESYLTPDQLRELIARDDVPPATFARTPLVRASGGCVKLHIPLRGDAKYPVCHRTIVVNEAVVASKLSVPGPVGDHDLESFARREVDMIARAAVAQHNAQSTEHLLSIDDPPRRGLPDIITLREL